MTEDRTGKEDFTDSELESFIRENREILSKLLRQEKDLASRLYNREAQKAEELKGKAEEFKGKAEEFKGKAEEKTIEFIAAVTDPEIHKHFMMAGFEFLMGMSAMVKALPMPEMIRTTMDLAKETRDKTYEEARAKYPDKKGSSGSGGAASRKIDITDKSEEGEPAPKKKAKSKTAASRKVPAEGSEPEPS